MKVGIGMHSDRLFKFRQLQHNSVNNICGNKILAQLGFLLEMSATQEHRFDDTILPQIERLFDAAQKDGAITVDSCAQVLGDLSLLSTEAEKYKVLCVVQPKMWGEKQDSLYIVRQVRHAIMLLEQRPEISYFEPRAAVYRMLETHYPILLNKIKELVKSGRWELGLTSWKGFVPEIEGSELVLEGLIRNRDYLAELFEVEKESIKIHFELQGFCQDNQIIEMLSALELGYNYCYGHECQDAYPINSKGKKEMFCVQAREQNVWDIHGEQELYLSEFFRGMNNNLLLRVFTLDSENSYCVGKSLDNIKELSSWPLFPSIEHSTMGNALQALSDNYARDTVNVGNPYTYSDIGFYGSKRDLSASKWEREILDAKILDAQANMISSDYKALHNNRESYVNILGTAGGRASYHNIYQLNAEEAVNTLCLEMNTDDIHYGSDKNTGFEQLTFAVQQHRQGHLPAEGTGGGNPYLFTVFNTTQYKRDFVVEVEIKNWKQSPELLKVLDSKGKALLHQVEKDDGRGNLKIAFLTQLPEFGYMTYRVTSREDLRLEPENAKKKIIYKGGERVLLENQYIRALFSVESMSLLSFKNKETDRELISGESPTAIFKLVLQESESVNTHRMAPAMVKILNNDYPVHVTDYCFGPVRIWLEYEIPFEGCTLKTRLTLNQNSKNLCWNTHVKWAPESLTPAGNWKVLFELSHNFYTPDYRYVSEWGMVDNPTEDQILMGADGIAPIPLTGEETVAVMAKGHHSFYRYSNKISVNLLDGVNQLAAEDGHSFTIGAGAAQVESYQLSQQVVEFTRPIITKENSEHSGRIPPFGALMSVKGNGVLLVAERSDTKLGMHVRFYNPTTETQSMEACFVRKIAFAYIVDYNGEQLDSLHLTERDLVGFDMPPKQTVTIQILFE